MVNNMNEQQDTPQRLTLEQRLSVALALIAIEPHVVCAMNQFENVIDRIEGKAPIPQLQQDIPGTE